MKYFCILLYFLSFQVHADSIRLLTGREIPFYLEAVTDVNYLYRELREFYNNNFSKFPLKGELNEYKGQLLLGVVSYSALFCEKMIERDEKQPNPSKRHIHQYVDFQKAPADLPSGDLEKTLDEYAIYFYQRQLDKKEMITFKEIYQDISQDLPSDASSTPKVWLGVCASFGASFEFLTK